MPQYRPFTILMFVALGTAGWNNLSGRVFAEDSPKSSGQGQAGRREKIREALKKRMAEGTAPEADKGSIAERQPKIAPKLAGVAYADRAKDPRRNQLDVYAGANARPGPAGEKGLPVLMFVHGGAWKFGDKAYVGGKPQAAIDNGFVFVANNYRFVPEVTFREQAADVASAVAWVRKHIAEQGGDPDRIYLMGHSAGAHLAALVCTDEKYLKAAGESFASIKGVVLLDGAGYDVTPQVKFGPDVIKKMYTDAFGETEADWVEASPTRRVADAAKGTHFPPFLIHHVASRMDSRRQSNMLAEALKAQGGVAEVHPGEGKSHMTINQEFGQTDDPVTKTTWEFIKQHP